MAGGRKGGRNRRRKVCFFTANGITHIDYKDVDINGIKRGSKDSLTASFYIT